MATESKKPNIMARVFSRFSNGKRNKPAVAPSCRKLERSSTVTASPSSSSHSPTHSAPDIIPQYHESQASIHQSRSENGRFDSLQCALSIPGNNHPPGLRTHSGTSFLTGASGFRMGDIHYYEASHLPANTSGGTGDRSIDGWELLLKKTAPNALHNSSARYDAPKCDEDTRVEVTSEIMGCIEDRDSPQPRLLCMTGPAGSGKSALQQTVSIKCNKCNILAASFFFSATDPSRNTVEAVIPTIAYQLGRRNPLLKHQIKNAVEDEPLIFSQSLEAQMVGLIVEPLGHLKDMGFSICSLPYAILIDGLDECNGEDRQAELLTAIRRCLLADDLPFRIFIASRPEWAIRTALEAGGHLYKVAYHIQLSDQYDASADMVRYLRRRFEGIGQHIGDPQWFTEDNIKTLVAAASGQFIYVATVYKYISERRASPMQRLMIVLTWTPHETQIARPFQALDVLYTNILLAAKKAYEAVDTHSGRDFLMLVKAHHINTRYDTTYGVTRDYTADFFSVHWLGLEARAEESLISDLHSLVALERDSRGNSRLRFYHKSFSDFLDEESRAKDLFVPKARVYTHISKYFMQCIIECQLDSDSVPHRWEEIPLPESPKHSLIRALQLLPIYLNRAATAIDDEVADFTRNGGWRKIDNFSPLMFCPTFRWRCREIEGWMDELRRFTDNIKPRKPDVAAAIGELVEKWEWRDTVIREPEIAAVIMVFVAKWESDDKEWDLGWGRQPTGRKT